MTERLAQRGYLPGSLADAFRRVDRRWFVPVRLRALAGLDLPLPVGNDWSETPSLSPRVAALLLGSLGIEPGDSVLVDGVDGGHLAALAAELAGPRGTVVLATGSAKTAAAASRRLRTAGYPPERVRAVADAPFGDASWNRILLAEEAAFVPTPARRSLADLGVLVTRTPRAERLEVVRVVRAGNEFAEIHLGELAPASRPLGPGVEEAWPLRRILALEEALRRVWSGRPGSAEEVEFERAVDETWHPHETADETDLLLARKLFHSGYVLLMAGDLEAAEDAYRASLATAPTAESLTFLGWTWSFSGRFEDAIQACVHALSVDPLFGNAYNDIGAYLIELGRPDDAIEWLERAMQAPRYEARAYPYVNLARARLLSGDRDAARDALERALRMDPDYAAARELLEDLEENGSGVDDP